MSGKCAPSAVTTVAAMGPSNPSRHHQERQVALQKRPRCLCHTNVIIRHDFDGVHLQWDAESAKAALPLVDLSGEHVGHDADRVWCTAHTRCCESRAVQPARLHARARRTVQLWRCGG